MSTDTKMIIAIAAGAGFLLGMLTIGVWGNSNKSEAAAHPDHELLTSETNYQFKYAREVCRQRNGKPHFIAGKSWIVCMENGTNIISDFD